MNGNNILLVEDDSNDAELISLVLSRTGWHIVHAQNSAEAQRILYKSSNFRLACIDLKLGGSDGAHLVRWIREHFQHVPVAVISGFIDQQARTQLADCGAVFLFNKPFTSNDVLYLLNFMDVTEAIFKRGRKLKPSWITSTAGAAVIAMGIGHVLRHPEQAMLALGFVVAGAGLLGAQDSGALKKLLEIGKSKEK
jgi:CheY-like chemotaxis protein